MRLKSVHHSQSLWFQNWKWFKGVPLSTYSIYSFPPPLVMQPGCSHWTYFQSHIGRVSGHGPFLQIDTWFLRVKSHIVPRKRISTRCTRSSSNPDVPKYSIPNSKTLTYQRSFVVRATRIWNTLADELKLSMDNLSTFKTRMLHYYFTCLNNTYDIDDPRTFKTICTKCNSSRSLGRSITCF